MRGDVDCRAAQAAGHARDVDRPEGRPRGGAAGGPRQTVHDGVAAVGHDEQQHPDLAMGGAPQRLNRVHRGAVTDDPDDRTLGIAHPQAHGAGDPEAQAAVAAGHVPARMPDGQTLVELGLARRRLLHDHRLARQALGQRRVHMARQQGVAGRRALAAPAAARAPGLRVALIDVLGERGAGGGYWGDDREGARAAVGLGGIVGEDRNPGVLAHHRPGVVEDA